jgi:hypothetical protein
MAAAAPPNDLDRTPSEFNEHPKDKDFIAQGGYRQEIQKALRRISVCRLCLEGADLVRA